MPPCKWQHVTMTLATTSSLSATCIPKAVQRAAAAGRPWPTSAVSSKWSGTDWCLPMPFFVPCVSAHRTAALGRVFLLVLHHAHHVGLAQVIQQLQCMQRRSAMVRSFTKIPHGKPPPHQCKCMTALHDRPPGKIAAKSSQPKSAAQINVERRAAPCCTWIMCTLTGKC